MGPSKLGRGTMVYPETDGEPIAETTVQFDWVVKIKEGTEAIFRDDPNVFVAGDLFWYPVEGDIHTRTAPDTMVVFGRPQGPRGSYVQAHEEGIAPQVVFEVLSPGNRPGEMHQKLRFYEKYGVEEYYLYDPEKNDLEGWLRDGADLRPIATMKGWVSPRLGVRFDWTEEELKLVRPDGRVLQSFQETDMRAEAAERDKEAATQRAEAAERDKEAAKRQSKADKERAKAAEKLAEAEKQRASAAEERAQRLAARLRALGLDPENGATD